MEKPRYRNFLGEVFDLEQSWIKCLELEDQSGRLLARLEGRGPSGGRAGSADSGLLPDLRRFLRSLPGQLRSMTPRPPALPLVRPAETGAYDFRKGGPR